MNAYTSSMANFAGGGMANPMSSNQLMHGRQQNNANNVMSSLPTGGIRTAFHYNAPATTEQQPPQKKQKQEHDVMNTNMLGGQPFQNMQQQQVTQQPGMQLLTQQQAAVAALALQGLMQPNVVGSGGDTGVPLPVGVGLRLGGAGGIAPAMAQSSARLQGMLQGNFNIWGGMAAMMPDQNKVERRERNREHAKRSRVRKKFMLEALQGEVHGLQKENQQLRLLIQEHIPEHAMQIFTECCTASPLFNDDDIGGTGDEKRKAQVLVKSDFALMQTLTIGQQCFVLSDPKLPDNPIVFASPGFYEMTGYTSKEVLGRNCRFLQGPGTDRKAVDIIRHAINTGSDTTVCLLNYKADGTPFWNQFFVAALRDSDNNIVNFVSMTPVCWILGLFIVFSSLFPL